METERSMHIRLSFHQCIKLQNIDKYELNRDFWLKLSLIPLEDSLPPITILYTTLQGITIIIMSI